MAGCTYIQVLRLTVITEILLLCVAQNTHMQNVAIGKTCGISSKYFSSDTCSAAINGNNKDLNYPGNCIHTAENDNSPFWWVDLGNEFTISTMTIYGRTYQIGRMAQVNIFLDKNIVKSFTSQDTWINDKHVITVGRAGRMVNITKDSNTGSAINICEVEVWVCDDGWYGDCTQACGRCAGGSDCDKVNGNCTTCQTGFQLPHCQACDNGWYGDNCTQACGRCSGGAVCDKVTGSCTSCQTGFQLPLCKMCSDGRYGNDCQQTCGRCASGVVCNKVTGNCTSCQPSFQLPLCKVCRDGWYGNDCQQTCGQCAGGSVCNKVDGSCTSCQNDFQLPLCKVCRDGRYGNDCQQTCGQCASGVVCDKVTGSCTSCQTGFQSPTCKECANGWYGDSCTQTCGHCANTSVCDKVNGNCISCQTGFQPPLCQECADGWYGANCTQTCGNCLDASVCNKVTGDCTSCKSGFQLPLCKECVDGWYGGNCTQTCGNCADGSFCDKVNGTCVSCKTGFNPPFCTDCQDGWYGDNCAETCGHCMGGNSTCDKTNGSCPSCDGELQLPLCKEPMKLDQTKSSGPPVGSIVGPVLAVIVAAVVVVIVVLWLRRRHQAKGNQSRLTRGNKDNQDDDIIISDSMKNVGARTENKPIAPVKPQMHPKYEASDTHLYGNLCVDTPNNVQSTSVMTSVNTTNGGDKNAKSCKSLATKERTDNRIYENVDLKTNLPTKSDDTNYKKSTKLDTERETMDPTDEEEESIYNTEDIYASYRSLGPSSILDDLQKSLLASLASGKLGMEFAEFSKDMQHPHEAGSKPENRNKNRFKALCAYDHSRVVLRWPKGDNNSDYINANYIKGCKQDKAYIATQGPRSNTVSDLWWMVWQDNVTQIIMLTNLKEGGKDKCEEYWPPVGTTKTYGHVTVTALKTDSRADFVVRHFVVENKKGGDQRTVSQYHYLVWPDHGVPSTYSLVSFWRYVKARAQGAIPVVHCSAGVGRTGTYIALDIAADLRSRGRDVNVKDIVSGLREDRTLMVQTEEQYKFLHEVILEEHTSHGTRLNFDQFDAVFPSNIDAHNSRINMEFKLLEELGRFVPKPKHQIAESDENRLKNRNKESLPDDSHLVYLMDRVPGRNQYINAVHVSSFRKVQGLILTQLPLPDTVVDMWRLVDGWDVNTIVSLGHRNQSQSVKNYCHYWPETVNEVLKTGQHTIKLTSTSTLGDHLTCYNLSLMTKTSTPREVRVLYYDDWAGVVPGNSSDILHLMDTLESWHIEENTSPVVVQCNDGMTRSGMFCALYEVINGARHDQEIDVYLSVRHVQSVRPKAVTTEAQYRYCYQVAQECKRQESIYQNT